MAPRTTTEQPSSEIVELVAVQKNVTDRALIERSKKAFENRQKLRDLASQIGGQKAMPLEKDRAVNSLLLASEYQLAIAALKNTIATNVHDFDGPDSYKKKTEQNPAYLATIKLFSDFCEVKNQDWPVDLYAQWVKAVSETVATEVQSYAANNIDLTVKGSMNSDDAKKLFENLGKADQSGIGDFDTWFNAKHPVEFKAWQDQVSQNKDEKDRATLTRRLEEAKKQIPHLDKLEAFNKRFSSVDSEIASPTGPGSMNELIEEIDSLTQVGVLMGKEFSHAESITERFNKLSELARNGLDEEMRKEAAGLAQAVGKSDANSIGDMQKNDTKWDERVTAAETLTQKATEKKLPEAVYAPLLIQVLKGEQTYDQAEGILNTLKIPDKPKAVPPTPPPPAEKVSADVLGEDEGWTADKWLKSLDETPSTDKGAKASAFDTLINSWKKLEKIIAVPLLAIFAKVATSNTGSYIESWAGFSVRDKFISSEWLAAHGDKRAVVAVAGKNRLKNELKLLPSTMEKMRGLTAKGFAEAYKTAPKDFSDDPDQLARLDRLLARLKAKVGNQTKDIPVFELVGAAPGGQTLIPNLADETPVSTAPAADAKDEKPITKPADAPKKEDVKKDDPKKEEKKEEKPSDKPADAPKKDVPAKQEVAAK